MVNLIVEGDVPEQVLRMGGVEVNTHVGSFSTVRCPLSRLGMLATLPGVRRLHAAGKCKLSLDRSAVEVGATQVRQVVPPNFAGRAGAGVLIGIVDSGVDLHHGDFCRPDQSTRIVSAWDQTTKGHPPTGFTYGTEWTAADINAQRSTMRDYVGHGTHAMGIASGDGSRTNPGKQAYVYVGMAPEADLCVVETDLQSTSIVDGVNYIFQVAQKLHEPAVVNLSLGTQDGPHDGTYALDQMIAALCGPGKIVVAAAGNDGADSLHAAADVAAGAQTLTLEVPPYTPQSDAVNDYIILGGWYRGTDQVSLEITTPSGMHLGPIAPGDSLVDQDTPDGYLNIYNATTSPSNGDHEIYAELFDATATKPPKSGLWSVRLAPISVSGPGHVDMYITDQLLGGGEVLATWQAGVVSGGVVTSPGDADSVICAGAYTTKACWDSKDGHTYCWNPTPIEGTIADFSSQGPRRDGVLKPDLTAPGFGVASAMSADAQFATSFITPDGAHVVQAGTSFATPHVAGTVALLLSQGANAHAGPTWILDRLKQTARSDGFTGATPNPVWGYGKLSVSGAMGPGLSVHFLRPAGHFESTTGLKDSIEVAVNGGRADSLVLAYSKDGGLHFDQRLGALPGVAAGVPQIFVYTPTEAMKTYGAEIRGIAYDSAHGNSVGFTDSLFTVEPPVAFGVRAVTPTRFNDQTVIRFDLDRPGSVSLRVFSVRGRLIRTLLASVPTSAGRHDVAWDGRTDKGDPAPSGVYFCKLQSDQLTSSGRLLLVR
jgi:hypothetical protein